MTAFATNLAAGNKKPVYLIEFDGTLVEAFDSAAPWAADNDASSLAVDTADAKEGVGSMGWNKAGGTSVFSGVITTSLTAFDTSNYAYMSLWVKIPDLTDIASFEFYLGQDFSNYYKWIFDDSILTAGWQLLRFPWDNTVTGITYSTTGSPTRTSVDSSLARIVTDLAANTLSGLRVDELRGHPFRYSTSTVTAPRAPTKHGWMRTPNLGVSKMRPQDGVASVAPGSVMIVDDDGSTVLSDIENLASAGTFASIWMGFMGETESDTTYQPIYRGQVNSPKHAGRAWEFSLSDTLSIYDVPFMLDATEASPVTVTGTVANVLLTIMLSTGNGNNVGDGTGTYDTLTASEGAGIDAERVNVANIEATGTDSLYLDTVSFTFTEPVDSFLSWAFAEIFKPHGIVPAISEKGKFDITVVRPPFGSGTATAIDRTNVISGRLPPVSVKLTDIVNQIQFKHSWNTTTEDFDSVDATNLYKDQDSIDRYGVRAVTIESKGITTDAVARRCARRILKRLSNGAPPITVDCFATQQARVMGDIVTVTLPRIVPDLSAKTYGINGVLSTVIGRGFNPTTGRTTLVLAQTQYRAGNYRVIGPAGLANYDSQSAAQKAAYGSISDTSQLLGTANDPTHEIGPS